jgi:hypothetical protein
MTLAASVPASIAAALPHAAASATRAIPLLPADASWLSILQGCVPVAIAAMVAWVGWRQLATARAKLKLDLFEKRLAIFDITWEALSKASRSEITHPNELIPLHNKVPEAAFLFGTGIGGYLETIKSRIAEQQVCLLQLHERGPYATQELTDKIKALQAWFHEECLGVKAKFAPYLNFDSWR